MAAIAETERAGIVRAAERLRAHEPRCLAARPFGQEGAAAEGKDEGFEHEGDNDGAAAEARSFSGGAHCAPPFITAAAWAAPAAAPTATPTPSWQRPAAPAPAANRPAATTTWWASSSTGA